MAHLRMSWCPGCKACHADGRPQPLLTTSHFRALWSFSQRNIQRHHRRCPRQFRCLTRVCRCILWTLCILKEPTTTNSCSMYLPHLEVQLQRYISSWCPIKRIYWYGVPQSRIPIPNQQDEHLDLLKMINFDPFHLRLAHHLTSLGLVALVELPL